MSDKKIGIWIRVSTEDQARGESPETHLKRARLYAEMKGWEVATVYDLKGVSGSIAMDHQEAKRMRADVAAGRIDALIFSKLARLARDTKQLLDIADFFKEHEADLVSLGESIDTSSPAGRFFYTLLAAMAAWEREETVDRVKASVKTRAKAGKSLGGAAPFGFRWEDKELVPNDEESPVVRELFATFIRERRVLTTATKLSEAGYRTRRGAKFSSTTVKRLLQNPAMKGMHRLNYTESRGEGKGWDKKPESEWEYTEVPPIVSPDVWEEAQAVLKETSHGPRKRGRKSPHLFSGLVFCSACDEKMYVPSNSPKYTCRSCRRKIRKRDLEEVFLSRLSAFLLSKEEVAEYLSEATRRLQERRALLRTLKGEKRSVERDMRDVFALFQDNALTPKQFKRRNDPLEERLKALSDEIPRVEGEVAFLEVEAAGSEDIVSEGELLIEGWSEIPKEDRRIIVEHLLFKITVTENEVIITLRGAPKAPPAVTSGGGDPEENPPSSSSQSDDNLGPNPQGFILQISATRAGKRNLARVRTTSIAPSSKG